METHDVLASITALTEAVADRCGMMASFQRLSHASGSRSTRVQICLVPISVEPNADDWVFIEAKDDADLPRVRDELAAFIAANRKEEEAA